MLVYMNFAYRTRPKPTWQARYREFGSEFDILISFSFLRMQRYRDSTRRPIRLTHML